MNGWRTLFPNAWYISGREFRGRVRSRSFVLGTVILAVIAFAATQIPVLIDVVTSTSQTRVEVVVEASGMPADAQTELTATLNSQSATADHPPFVVTWLPGGDLVSAHRDLVQGKFDALLIVARDPVGQNLGFSEIRARQVRAVEDDVCLNGLAHVRTGQVSAGEVGVDQLAADQFRPG